MTTMSDPHPPPAATATAKLAVIGCGAWGKNLVRNFAGLGALAAIHDADAGTAQAMAQEHDVPAADWAAILADPDIAAVAIAAPATHHYRLAREALEAGKHAFVEKPLALQVAEAEALCELAERGDRRLMVGHLLQYHPAFLKLREMVREGAFGRLQYLYSNRLNLGRVRREEDILWSFAPHDISMILSLAGGEPEHVSATGACYLHKTISDVTTTHLSFPSGEQAHVFVSWLHPFKEQKLVVVGERGMAVFDDGEPWESKLVFYRHSVGWRNGAPVPEKAEAEPVPVEAEEPLRRECGHFLDCIATGATPRTDGREGLRVLRVLDRARAALDPARAPGGTPAPGADPDRPSFTGVTVHATAQVDAHVEIGPGTRIWHFSHILPDTVIGRACVIGQNVAIGPGVRVGDGCKIQNNVSIYKGVTLEDGVFCGPSCVFTNVTNPRAEIERKDEFQPTLVKRGATIGANATIVCPVTLGEYSFVAAGAVVTRDVPAHALVAGVPARRIGWVSHAGEKLGEDLVCPRTGERYVLEAPESLVRGPGPAV